MTAVGTVFSVFNYDAVLGRDSNLSFAGYAVDCSIKKIQKYFFFSGVDLISSYSDMDQAVSPPLSPCFGFHESDIPESSIEVTPDDEETIENIQVLG